MAKYDATYACGHSETVKLVGRERDRQRKLQWFAARDCSTCAQMKRDAEHHARSIEHAAANARAGYPALLGTPRQVAWAETLRAEALAAEGNSCDLPNPTVDLINRAGQRAGLTLAQAESVCEACIAAGRAARHALEQQADANWWIDNRGGGSLGDDALDRRVVNAMIAEKIRVLGAFDAQLAGSPA